MKYTSAEANKLLKKLNSDYQTLLINEKASRTFLAATGEDPETVRPPYDYERIEAAVNNVAKKIRTVKHAINVFNATTKLNDFGITIDEMLVMLPQLTEKVTRLDEMRTALPKVRERTYGSGINATIDYRYVNYDIETANKDYAETFSYLSKAQTALDIVNNTAVMEIDI